MNLFRNNLDVVVGNGAEGVASSAPLLGHLVHVGRPSVAFQGLVLLAGAPDEKSLMLEKSCWHSKSGERGTHSHKFGVTRINFKVNERVKSFNPCCFVPTDI